MPDPTTLALLLIAILLLICLLIVVIVLLRRKPVPPPPPLDPATIQLAIGQGLHQNADLLKWAVTSGLGSSGEALKGVMSSSLLEVGVQTQLGEIKSLAAQVQSDAASLRRVLEVSQTRGQFGEVILERLLKDSIPAASVHIRESLPEIGTPDAYVDTPDGMLCIDSKFPLENYRAMITAADRATQKKSADAFQRDVMAHFDKVGGYVKPGNGTTPFAFAFIPSEAVYAYLAESAPAVFEGAIRKAVVVVSPSTVIANLALIIRSTKARQIEERAVEIQRQLDNLSHNFDEFATEWTVLRKHLQNAAAKAADADSRYQQLKASYDSISRLDKKAESAKE
jgi:DNA recombination protein RmuC